MFIPEIFALGGNQTHNLYQLIIPPVEEQLPLPQFTLAGFEVRLQTKDA